jgi:iron complex transport system ATP-binding protein
VLLLDEPTAHLDITNRVEILTLLRNLTRESGHSVLVSTHDLELALKLADEIWVMLPERQMVVGTPEEIIHTGCLDLAFGNSSLYFNPDIGGFSLKEREATPIVISGKGNQLDIGEKAFERLGFSTEMQGEPIARLHVDEDTWSIQFEEQITEKLNLTEVCRILRELGKKVSI